MISSFDIAVDYVIKNEGTKFTDDKKDDGGATKFGLTLKFLRYFMPNFTKQMLKDLGIDEAKKYYKIFIWDTGGYQNIVSQPLCNYVFDSSVHHGEPRAVRLIQQAIFSLARNADLLADGVLGTMTLHAVNHYGYELLAPLRSERAGYMRLRAAVDKDNEKFLAGWLRRAYEFVD